MMAEKKKGQDRKREVQIKQLAVELKQKSTFITIKRLLVKQKVESTCLFERPLTAC